MFNYMYKGGAKYIFGYKNNTFFYYWQGNLRKIVHIV